VEQSVRPLFTVHAGEFLVGQHIESSFKDKNVWVPTKDTGIDLLVTNSENAEAVALQVKFSRDFLPLMKLTPVAQKQLRSYTWFTLDQKHLARSHGPLRIIGFLRF
jgi:predicted helicase